MSGGLAPRILNFGILDGGEWLYPRGKIHRYALDRRLDRPHRRFGCCGEEKMSKYKDI